MEIDEVLRGLTLETAIHTAITLVVCLVFKQILGKLISKSLERTSLDQRISNTIKRVSNGVMWFVIALIVCQGLGINMTSMVALLGVVGLAFSLALQDSLSNIAGGIMILSSRTFRLGDFVEAGGEEGTVDSISLIYTHLRTADNRIISIPNSKIMGGKIVNFSAAPDRRIEIKVSASYDDPTDSVRAALLDAVASVPNIKSNPAPAVFLTEYGDSAITYSLRVWVKNADFWNVRFKLNETIRECFAKHGISMTYNHLNVHISNK